LHVEENEIGIVLLDEVDGFDAVLTLCDHVDVTYTLEQEGQLVAGKLLVVNDEGGKGHD
jgi:hypothetical protein